MQMPLKRPAYWKRSAPDGAGAGPFVQQSAQPVSCRIRPLDQVRLPLYGCHDMAQMDIRRA